MFERGRVETDVVQAKIESGRDNLNMESFRDNQQRYLLVESPSDRRAIGSNRSHKPEQKQRRTQKTFDF